MSSILIINFKRHGDIFSNGNLISSIHAKTPNSKIHILVYDEFSRSAELLTCIEKVHKVDRKKIITILKSELFNDAQGLELLKSELAELKNTNWTQIINVSNDKFSAHIASYLASQETEITGLYCSEQRKYLTNDEWSSYFNDIQTTVAQAPINFVDTFKLMAKASENSKTAKIKSNQEHNLKSFEYFKKIRQFVSRSENTDVKLIGIQLKSSTVSKDIPAKDVVKLIGRMIQEGKFFPIILIAPIADEQELASDINELYQGKLIIIETEFSSLPSVLSNLDGLITPDTSVKHMADLCDTPLVEVSYSDEVHFKQGTIGVNNLIIAQVKNDSENRYIDYNDIYNATEALFDSSKIKTIDLNFNTTLYQVNKDKDGTYIRPVAGDVIPSRELNRFTMRNFLFNNEANPIQAGIWNNQDVQQWAATQKDSISEVTKSLLSTLRALLLTKSSESPANQRDLYRNLIKLVSYSEDNQLISVPVMKFRKDLEANVLRGEIQDMQLVEKSLYKLKEDIQKTFSYIRRFEDRTRQPDSVLNN